MTQKDATYDVYKLGLPLDLVCAIFSKLPYAQLKALRDSELSSTLFNCIRKEDFQRLIEQTMHGLLETLTGKEFQQEDADTSGTCYIGRALSSQIRKALRKTFNLHLINSQGLSVLRTESNETLVQFKDEALKDRGNIQESMVIKLKNEMQTEVGKYSKKYNQWESLHINQALETVQINPQFQMKNLLILIKGAESVAQLNFIHEELTKINDALKPIQRTIDHPAHYHQTNRGGINMYELDECEEDCPGCTVL